MNWLPMSQYWPMPMLEKHNRLEPWSKPRLTSSPRLPDSSVTTLCVTKYLIKYFFVTHTTLDYPPINQHCKTFLRFFFPQFERFRQNTLPVTIWKPWSESSSKTFSTASIKISISHLKLLVPIAGDLIVGALGETPWDMFAKSQWNPFRPSGWNQWIVGYRACCQS